MAVGGLVCPRCGCEVTAVKDSRPSPIGWRRRRRCAECPEVFTTYEVVMVDGPVVISAGSTSRPKVEGLAPYLRRLQASITAGIGSQIDGFFGSLEDFDK